MQNMVEYQLSTCHYVQEEVKKRYQSMLGCGVKTAFSSWADSRSKVGRQETLRMEWGRLGEGGGCATST